MGCKGYAPELLVMSEMQRTFQTLPAVVCPLAAKRALLVQETIRVAWLECPLLNGREPVRMLRSRLRIDVARDLKFGAPQIVL